MLYLIYIILCSYNIQYDRWLYDVYGYRLTPEEYIIFEIMEEKLGIECDIYNDFFYTGMSYYIIEKENRCCSFGNESGIITSFTLLKNMRHGLIVYFKDKQNEYFWKNRVIL